MYKKNNLHPISFFDFNQSCGMQLDLEDEWVLLADRIPWDVCEEMYAEMFPSNTGNPTLSVRIALGLLICKDHHIEISGPKLGRPASDKPQASKDERQDEKDRIEVERFFSLDKRCNGAGLIMTKLSNTTLNTIALTVLVTNLFATPAKSFLCSISWAVELASNSSIIWRSILLHRHKTV